VCFGEAVYTGEIKIEGIQGKLAYNPDDADMLLNDCKIPVLVDPEAKFLKYSEPDILIDGRMLKKDIDASKDMADLVIGLGPGFYPGNNCHLAIETNRGPNLGKVLSGGSPQEDTAIPAPVNGFTSERVLRSPVDGVMTAKYEIGDFVRKDDIIAEINVIPVKSEINGILRGICRNGLNVLKNQKIGDIDPRGKRELCYKISDKAHAIADGTIKAIELYSKTRICLKG